MTSTMMLIVCTLLFLASKSDGANGDGANGDGANGDGANGDAKNDASDCQDNKNTGLLADHNCTVICNGSMIVSSSPIKAPNGTRCRIPDKAKSADETAQNKGVLYGKCQSNSCVTVGENGTVSTTVTTESSHSTNQAVSSANSTTTSNGNESGGTTKVKTTGVSSAGTTPPTTVAPSTTGTPAANTPTPATNTTTPAANGSSRSRLVSAAESQVLGVVLAIGALLLRAP